ncbi:MAG: phycocyanobilin:ferredoxin oxidoreductase [Leptolyngbya foveolarum]|uniref:Phycocyanobilin:ferredoxin oxidoreductase n=1 Tax=Leptolyngbya foveolarum TaxID=47253 RepID=A0A2W4TVY5_9CYAN|nr:MAG: phycocyanobilin:ferredoxin oxidoreductase [Leptolyngbya foveolarum]
MVQSPYKRPQNNALSDKSPKSLQKKQHPVIAQLAATIESIWHKQLMLFPYETPADLGYVEGTLEGEHLTIQNRCYQTLQFRKLHLELASVGNTLDILHCVMFPHPCFNLPIFGLDIVAAKGNITAAIVDLSPVSSDGSLPADYHQALSLLPAAEFVSLRELPKWGSIFSDRCVFVRPETPEECDLFLNQATQYLLLHCRLVCEATKINDRAARAAILAGQNRYCQQQQKNDKTRRILERAFDKQWAQRYLETMLFDCAKEDLFEI